MASLHGMLLVASPALDDSYFSRTVSLLVEHGAGGAMGLVLNRPLELPMADAWQQISKSPCADTGRLHVGGPVEGPLMVLHRKTSASQVAVTPDLHFCAEAKLIEGALSGDPEPSLRCFAGYAGWSAGQLEEELAQGTWVLARAEPLIVFGLDEEAQYEAAMRLADPALGTLARYSHLIPADPGLN